MSLVIHFIFTDDKYIYIVMITPMIIYMIIITLYLKDENCYNKKSKRPIQS